MRLIRLGEEEISRLLKEPWPGVPAGEHGTGGGFSDLEPDLPPWLAKIAPRYRPRPSAVALGSFDGLHLGHQALIAAVHEARERLGLAATGLFTFRHHPRDLLDPARAPRLLTPWGEKLALLAANGVDTVVVAEFCPPLARTPYDEFVRRFLIELLAMRHFVAGHDVHLGAGRGGNAQTLAALGGRLGYGFETIPALEVGGHTVSSSVLRKLLDDGEVAAARALLGRPYALWGEVGTGERRGRTLGYPTANLLPLEPHKLLPGAGVYAVRVLVPEEATRNVPTVVDGVVPEPALEISPALAPGDDLRDATPHRWVRYGGMLNFGRAPTFHDEKAERRVEVHLFDFTGDLKGRTLKVEWLQRLRGERRFDGAQELVAQLRRDEEQARRICAAR